MQTAERAHLSMIARGLSFGMTLFLLASLTLVILAYAQGAIVQPAQTAQYWILTTLALIIVGVTWSLSFQRISFALGSAAVFAAWWLLLFITLEKLSFSFGAAVALYIVLVAIAYAALWLIRFFALRNE